MKIATRPIQKLTQIPNETVEGWEERDERITEQNL